MDGGRYILFLSICDKLLINKRLEFQEIASDADTEVGSDIYIYILTHIHHMVIRVH